MRSSKFFRPLLSWSAATAVVACSFVSANAQQNSPSEEAFYKGYYLQHERNDLKKAIEAYKKSIALDSNGATRAAVDAEMADIQEDLASADFARLMPTNAIGYVQISNPANHVEKIAKLMGLTGREFSPSDEKVVLPIDGEIAISSDFQISPALLRELKKIRGAAAAITDFDVEGNRPPNGVLIVHPGDSDLVTGLVETGIQFVPTNEKIGGFPTFQVEGQIWIVKTKRLILVSPDKSEIEKCIARVSDPGLPSLAEQGRFEDARSKHEGAAVFTYVNPKRVLEKFKHVRSSEFAIARAIMDFDHINHITTALTTTDDGIQSTVDIDFSEDHNSLGYGLFRTAPLSGKALASIPSGAVGVVGMGLNPQMVMAAEVASSRHLTGMDIGREIFANIEEVGLFVLPSMASQQNPIPDFGLVIASSNVEKSHNLWNTLLSLPSSMKMKDGPQAKEINIDGVEARHYSIPGQSDIPQLVVARLNKASLIAGTEAAVRAAIASASSGDTLAKDPQAKALWSSLKEDTAKAVFVDVGRAMKMAAQMQRGRQGQEMMAVSEVIDDLALTLVHNESPNHFESRLTATGLPVFEDVIKKIAGFQKQARVQQRRGQDAAISAQNIEVDHVEIQQ